MYLRNNIFGAFLLIILTYLLTFTGIAYSGVIINFEGLSYDEIVTFNDSISNLPVAAVMIGSPFKGYEFRKKDTMVYDYYDIGDHFQRGSRETALGDPQSFSNLTIYFHGRKIEIYSKINLFIQKEGFNRVLWESSDFTSDSFAFSSIYYVNVTNDITRIKLRKIITFMTLLPVDKWVVDLREAPSNLVNAYRDFLREWGGGRFIILTDASDNNDLRISTADYYFIRTNIFVTPDPHLLKAKDFEGHSGWIQYIDSESLSVDNYAAMSFLLARRKDIVIPYVLFTSFGSRLIGFFLNSPGFTILPVSDDKLVIYNNDKVAAFNLSPSFSFWQADNFLNKKGFYKSIFGGSALILKNGKMEFFMLPQSAACWDISTN